jgi:hypothetical protein
MDILPKATKLFFMNSEAPKKIEEGSKMLDLDPNEPNLCSEATTSVVASQPFLNHLTFSKKQNDQY